MTHGNDFRMAHQRKRWLQPDQRRWFTPEAYERNFGSKRETVSPREAAREGAFDRELLALRRDHAALRRAFDEVKFALLLRKAGFNSDQPRVPRGNPDGGQWTRVGGPGGRSSRFGGNFPGATYGQQVRLDLVIRRTQDLVDQVRQFDANWRPRTQSLEAPGSFEGAIRRAEARAEEAQARLDQLRSGIGGNFGPPLEASPLRARTDIPSRYFDGPSWIEAYRVAHNTPDLFGRPTWPSDKGTVAAAEIDGSITVGVNSDSPGYTKADRKEANAWRWRLINKYPDVMSTDNIGRAPNDFVYHAEATILLRVAKGNGGTLIGQTIEVHVDREMCNSCKLVLPKLGMELGDPRVTFVDRSGARRTMQNGRWLLGRGD
jgi:hypothetical protein